MQYKFRFAASYSSAVILQDALAEIDLYENVSRSHFDQSERLK